MEENKEEILPTNASIAELNRKLTHLDRELETTRVEYAIQVENSMAHDLENETLTIREILFA